MYTNCELCSYPMTEEEICVATSGSFGQEIDINICRECYIVELGHDPEEENFDFEDLAYNELTAEDWDE